ncbi:2-hydroxymuconic semialdehyde dehydrogenase [Nitratireductor sp. L1-7-SE]|uniref:2-hydroxymuconic semialdehyde dehydrogenase n=1 Tax=Nitratireductor rhodophyticola TaxID=2854036 RepID=A0ABS7RCA4_9HYPH|nr:2-hydroxymuconic semialdehyde dehydrogenase [Nitratireductor rhodophyticola]MBY8918279.1 2-hydroxymuconic semialdehyde dehydrogenase [Nitratireductor rhodophyticola]MBY8920912.1 2-hydroxymuconic semialdehyde dehydrogenase [Nitratireductor rhodophyticola]
MKRIQNFINGRFVDGTGDLFENRFPATGEVQSLVSAAGEQDVDAAVSAAKRALTGPWARLTVQERIALLRKVADGINARFDEFLRAEIMDTGKPVSIASHIDIPRGAANFNVFADQIASVATEAFEMATPDGAGALNYAIRMPRGVIGVVCPWNLPLLLMTWKVAPALACGNTVVVKPSEETPATATLLGEVMNEAGIPEGVYNVVHGFGGGSTGEFLSSHPDVDAITFTGETTTGEAIMAAASRGVRPVSLELGGKNPGIVFDDADIDITIEGLGRSCFANTGQVCLGTERLYVQRGIFDEVAEKLAARARTYAYGDPFDQKTTMGPLISEEHRRKVLSYYEKAKAGGAEIFAGGGVPSIQGYEGGSWVEPTVWTGLPEDSPVVRDEIFGPCTHITPFDDEEEAIQLANNSPYGLATSIWTTNLSRGHRVAGRIDAGITWVNCWFLRDLRTAFGGSKRSGIGREGGVHSLEFYTELRNVCVKL